MHQLESAIEDYYADLNDCVLLTQKLNLIEKNFYYIKGKPSNQPFVNLYDTVIGMNVMYSS